MRKSRSGHVISKTWQEWKLGVLLGGRVLGVGVLCPVLVPAGRMGPSRQQRSAASRGVSGSSREADLAVNVLGTGLCHPPPPAPSDSLRIRLPSRFLPFPELCSRASWLPFSLWGVSPFPCSQCSLLSGAPPPLRPGFPRGSGLSRECQADRPQCAWALAVAPGPVLLPAPSMLTAAAR